MRCIGEKATEGNVEKAALCFWGRYLLYIPRFETGAENLREKMKSRRSGGSEWTEDRNVSFASCIFLQLGIVPPSSGSVQSRTHQYWMSLIPLQNPSCQSELKHASATNRQGTFTSVIHLCFDVLPLTQCPSVSGVWCYCAGRFHCLSGAFHHS